MYAMSFVGTVRSVEARFTALRRHRRLDDERPIRRCVERALADLADLVELVVVAFPVPPLSRPRSADDDEAVESVLRRTYEREDPMARDEADPAVRALDGGRLETVAGTLLVPLPSAGPAAANWYVLYPWLGDRLDAIRQTCGRLAGRIDAQGWPAFADALLGLREVVTDLRSVVGHAVAVTDWIAPPDGGIDDEARDARRTAARLVRKLSNEL
ncbi:hypothetical protein [Halorussus amylolyticus]|uniref:hypothetical protein n=1 Tax=Halorussus amylolyticus TaxID=1126242 RepID=UPI001048DEFC|nr:hypothetical protein [Halorussus amylolyticus]